MPRTVVDNPSHGTTRSVAKPNGKRAAIKVHERLLSGGAELLTIGPEDSKWTEVAQGGTVYLGDDLKGCIVRLVPPLEAEVAHVELMETMLRALGAAAVKVLPRPKASVLPQLARPAAEKRGVRQVVMDLVGESNSQDREALTSMVEDVMSKAGL